MIGRVLFILCAFVVLASSSLAGRTKPVSPGVDEGYVSALAAANRFLYAWQTQDAEGGVVMLTDDAKKRLSEDQLQQFFTHAAGASYQITRGAKLRDGRYAFPVALFVAGSPGVGSNIRPRLSHIVIVRTSEQDWAVDRLP